MNTEFEVTDCDEGCPECGSNNIGWEACGYCNGSSEAVCGECGGDGEVVCDERDGGNEDCDFCYGDGTVEYIDCWGSCEWEVCQDCGAEID